MRYRIPGSMSPQRVAEYKYMNKMDGTTENRWGHPAPWLWANCYLGIECRKFWDGWRVIKLSNLEKLAGPFEKPDEARTWANENVKPVNQAEEKKAA